ncbi:hypothetical protein HYALB_00002661 [Hymenoscyphus albidus]|uniref:Nucleoporin NUP49/NSP49 n=1 Tax=Hymenoscyphus albidus TaxID=595503 RepID=A0A9N9LUI8_9HELO|nr:hypothetical protein HYALB_00002661 [Hymenoscyphus albidus]
MAFARSASGPGGLSINTSSANSTFNAPAGGMFSNAGANKPAGGLFGAAATSTPAPAGGLFGTASTTTQPQSSGLSGAAAAPASQAPATGGLFGAAAATQAPAAGGLFGTAATSQPQTGGLFGATTATTQPQTGGLFGGATAGTQPQAAAGGLFGAADTTAQPQTGGLFGGAAAATTQPPAGGLFGGAASTAQPQTGGLFGGLNSTQNKPAATSLFGGFGGAQNQQNQQQNTMSGQQNQAQGSGLLGGGLSLGQGAQNPQMVPGVRIDLANLRGTTRFEDLYPDLQQQITVMDDVIQNQISLKNQCDAMLPSHDQQLSQIPNDVAYCSRKLTGVEGALVSDVNSIAYARELINTDADNARLSFKAIDNLKLPAQYHNTGMWSTKSPEDRSSGNGEDSQDIVGLFSKTADELSATLNKYQNNISEIEQHLRGVEANSAQQINAFIAKRSGGSASYENPVAELGAALTEFEHSILGVASKIGGAREQVQNLKLSGLAPPGHNASVNGRRGGVY